MKFTLASAVVLGCLSVGFCPLASAQSSAPAQPKEQTIIFSTPDGATTSSAPLPAAEAPQVNPLLDSPSEVPVNLFHPQLPTRRLPRPARAPMSWNPQNGLQDPNDIMGSPSSAEIMGVPSLEEIFGLPKSSSTNGQNQAGEETTNIISSDRSPDGESSWDRKMADEEGDNANDPNQQYGSSSNSDNAGASGSFFSSAFGNSVFADHHKGGDDSTFGSPVFAQTMSPPPALDSSLPAPDTSVAAGFASFAPKAPAFNSAFDTAPAPQSSFSFPKSSLQTAPPLPSTPVFQNPYSSFSQPAAPVWQPIAPWQQTVPPLGTMTPRKF